MACELTHAARTEALARLHHWTYDDRRRALFRRIVASDFQSAFALMVQIAMEAEKADHHPEWSNVYSQIDIWLTTHDAGGVSNRDIELAALIDKMVLPGCFAN